MLDNIAAAVILIDAVSYQTPGRTVALSLLKCIVCARTSSIKDKNIISL